MTDRKQGWHQQFKLLTALTSDDLSAEVNKYLRLGWVVYGFPWFIDPTQSNSGRYCQAVSRWSAEEPSDAD